MLIVQGEECICCPFEQQIAQVAQNREDDPAPQIGCDVVDSKAHDCRSWVDTTGTPHVFTKHLGDAGLL